MAFGIKKTRIGIYAGVFNPVHSGHISFALQARDAAKLDEIYFLPERMPRNKPNAEHYGHRVAMLQRAVKPYGDLSVIEVVDKHLTVHRTLPQLNRVFSSNCQLVFLMGADAFLNVTDWPGINRVVGGVEFVVSVRSQQELSFVLQASQLLGLPSRSLVIVDSIQPDVFGTHVRHAIRLNVPVPGLLPSVHRYARQEWLYAELPKK
jgi:nicotinate-nucleotide adenylyltransferase